MNEKEMNEALLATFPELKTEFDRYVAWQDGMGTGAFLTYEDVFLPRLERALSNGNGTFLDRAGTFIENLYLSEDAYAQNVVYVGVLEGLKADCDAEAVRAFLKPVTRQAFDELKY